MPLTQLFPPYPTFTDKNGDPLDAGYLYFGVVNLNPETNPIQVFFDADLTQPAAQPIRTINGYPSRNGSPAILFANSRFSVTVRDKKEALVVYGASLGPGELIAQNNLSDLTDASVARTNLALGATDSPSFAGLTVTTADALIHGITVGRGAGSDSSNTAVGNFALSSNTTGSGNTANGSNALLFNTTGSANTAHGIDALRNNTTGINNTAHGIRALQNNTIGSSNTANGFNALENNTTGSANTATGSSALSANTTGGLNTAIGFQALENNTTGDFNTANGHQALRDNTTGSNNTANGREALRDNTTGANNIGIGLDAGRSTSPRTITTASNEICIGNNDHTGAFIKIAFTVTSDERDKTKFSPIPHGLDFVNELEPTEYQFKSGGRDGDADGIRRYGFLAQDVLAAEGDNPVIVNSDDPDSLKMTHDYLFPVLVNAVKELTAQVNDLMAASGLNLKSCACAENVERSANDD